MIAAARKRAGMTQAQLAVKAGLDSSQLSRIERGAADPYFSTVESIAGALDLTVAELAPAKIRKRRTAA